MKKSLLCGALLLTTSFLTLPTFAQTAPPAATDPISLDALSQRFAAPPQRAGMRAFWWWLNGNVTKVSITKDLEAMKAKGFSGALIFDADGAAQFGNTPVAAGPTFGTPAWRELFKHAAREADRLGLVLSLNIESGWNLGGPDVTAAQASKILTWSETDVAGVASVKLAAPKSNDGFYKDIAVLAYPVKDGGAATATTVVVTASSAQSNQGAQLAFDNKAATFWVSGGTQPGEGPSSDRPETLQFDFDSAQTISGLKITGRQNYSPKAGEIQLSSDGKNFRSVKELSLKDGVPTAINFAATSATSLRILITGAYDAGSPTNSRNVQVSEVSILRPDGSAIGAATAGKARPDVANLRAKAVFTELGGSAPDTSFLLQDAPSTPGEEDAKLAQVVNISDKMGADGTLNWTPPKGNWHVMRFGTTYSGAKVSTSSADWQGRVLDHLSKDAVRGYWARNITPLLNDIGPLAGKSVKYVHTDSWEFGGTNWTDDFAAQFKARRGYDPTLYLPIVAGKILDNRDTGNAFLADLRKTIGAMVAENHYAVLNALAAERGMGIQPESAGPHAGPFDGIKDYGQSDIAMSEFWTPSPHRPSPPDRYFVKQAASAAHIYGIPLVGAEGFTSVGPHWTDRLWSDQKPVFDHELCSGLQLMFVHTFTSSPDEMGSPGNEYFAGTHFNRHVTWWDMAEGITSYIARCQAMMQQGRVVTDALYYYGDHVPNIAVYKESDPAKVLPGFDYDVTDEDVLLSGLTFKNGMLSLPSGQTYRVLVLPDNRVMSLAALRKVEQLVKAGATVIGPKTERIVSLQDEKENAPELKRIGDLLWGNNAAAGQNKVGKGRVIWNRTAREVLTGDGVTADFEVTNAAPLDIKKPAYDYIHRVIDGADVYFVINQTDDPVTLNALFRVSGRQPELWNALDGTRQIATLFAQTKGRTSVPLALEPYGSTFVVFRAPIAATAQGTTIRNSPTPIAEISGPWSVSFDPKWGAPAQVTFDTLESWTARPEPGVKFYSGKATYSKTIDLRAALPGERLLLELGDVRDNGIARVKLNGQDLGVTWTPPFRVDMTAAAKTGANQLEIEVANSWRNRLVRDRDLPVAQRLTRTNVTIKPDWQLVDSGLLGPVRVLSAAK